jgi:hypothetical protein
MDFNALGFVGSARTCAISSGEIIMFLNSSKIGCAYAGGRE